MSQSQKPMCNSNYSARSVLKISHFFTPRFLSNKKNLMSQIHLDVIFILKSIILFQEFH